jgi:hypothetical protein
MESRITCQDVHRNGSRQGVGSLAAEDAGILGSKTSNAESAAVEPVNNRKARPLLVVDEVVVLIPENVLRLGQYVVKLALQTQRTSDFDVELWPTLNHGSTS